MPENSAFTYSPIAQTRDWLKKPFHAIDDQFSTCGSRRGIVRRPRCVIRY